MRGRWALLILWLLSTSQGCGMLEFSRQVVAPPEDVDDYRSATWDIRRAPFGGRLPSDIPED